MKKRAIVCAMALISLALAAAAEAKEDGPKVTVMTRNVFLGADLGPALGATTLPAAVDGAGVIWNEFQSTSFPERAVPLALEIASAKPDLIGLQEVALWRKQLPSDGGAAPLGVPGAQPATAVEQDFLALLLKELQALDVHYQIVRVQREFDGELPTDVDGNDATGTGPLGAGVLGADFDARLTMRDVILARKGSKVKVGDTDGSNFANRLVVSIGGTPVAVDRGWLSVEGQIGGGNNPVSEFLFVDTHLEAFSAAIRTAQANELLSGPLDTAEHAILVGDLNSGLARHNILPANQGAFLALEAAGFADNGAPIHSCCYSDMFDAGLTFDHTVDHVLTRPGLTTKRSQVTGNDVTQRTPSGLWPSDHGGVVSVLQLKKN